MPWRVITRAANLLHMYVLEVDSLCKRFGRQQAVQDVSFGVERGQVFGLLGPNGSGKTTTIACALGLMRPDSGRSSVLGQRSDQLARSAGKMGAVFDQDNLIGGLTVWGNLEYARRLLGHAGGRSIRDVLELTGIADLAQRRARKLSLGQRKRVAVARALLGSPELLVLDEPLSALDPIGVKQTLQLIRELAGEGISVLLSSHRLHEMQAVITHAIVLADGRTRAQGSLQELLAEGAQSYRLCLLQVDNPTAVMSWLKQTFPNLACTLMPGRKEGETQFDLAGIEDGEFSAQLCAGLCQQGHKIGALIPMTHNLETFFESLVQKTGASV